MALRQGKLIGKRLKVGTCKVGENELFSKIQQKSYEIYAKRGYSHGSDWKDWLDAEKQVKKELGVK